MASRVLQRLTRVAAAVFVASVVLAGSAAARPTVPRTARSSRGFNLFAGSTNVVMNVNRVQCNINNVGETCVDPTNSPVLGGGFWPKGSPDQYIFNAGLQIAAIIPGGKTATFNWPGDTVGAFFFDPRGDQTTGEARTATFSSLRSDDLANWPTAAYANDTSLYAASLIGRANISQQEVWSRFWDGNVGLAAGARKHPMGILVESRGMAWNFPTGNEDILYFITRFINITSGVRSDYDALANSGYSTTDIDDIFAIAQDFRSRSQAAFNVQIPTNGFSWSNVYASFAEDPDVGNASLNYSNANLIFNMAMAWKSDFKETTWQFPPTMFGAPFLPAPGFESAKYLKTPGNLGITMAGNTTNGAPFPDAVGVSRLWRNLSGNLLPTDGSCSVPNPQARRFCQWVQTPVDTRFYAASGPFTVAPGQLATIVVALVHAAPVGASPTATPTCTSGFSGGSCGGIPAFALTPFIGADMKPGLSIEGRRLATALDTVRNLDRALGLLNFADANGDSVISQTEVTTVPRSLLNKGLVAQNVFDNKFLLPFAPEVPSFFLVPGDNQVTVAWQKSNTETIGDPFFTVASNPLSPLYDPNFRKFDVEGYRIWRGRTQSEMRVVASFDYSSTTFKDYTGAVFNSNFPNCAPELGATFNGTTPCGTTYTTPISAVNTLSNHTDYDISGVFVQVPPGGRVQLANGTILQLTLDTAVVGGGSGLPSLTDNDVPFAYTDRGVRNGFSYVYAVTAFDVNSVASGPSSLESPLVTKNVIPRAPSSNNQPAVIVTGVFGSDGVQLNPDASYPPIDAANGTFSGPVPPTNAGTFKFLASVAEALPPGDYVAQVDSLSAGFQGGIGAAPVIYMTFSAPGVVQHLSTTDPVAGFNAGATTTDAYSFSTPLVPYDSARSVLLGMPFSFFSTARMPVEFDGKVTPLVMNDMGNALTMGRFGVGDQPSRYLLHGRWFDESAGVEPPQPTVNFNPSKDHNSGKLTGVDSIWAPMTYRLPISGGTAVNQISTNWRGTGYAQTSWYPADFVVTWGVGGSITVRDSTHHVNLPFRKTMGSGYGFVSLANITGAGVAAADIDDGLGTASTAVLQYKDMYAITPVCTGDWWGITCANLAQTATLQPLDFNGDGTSDGNGIMLVINGEPFMMKMAALPASGTKWHLRAVGGSGLSATCTPALPASRTTDMTTPPTSCSGYSYTPSNGVRPAFAPGLQYKISVTQAFAVASGSGDLSNIHTVPDPYYVTNALELTANTKVLRFVNLPAQAIIRIYSSSGILVNILSHNDVAGGGEQVWNLRNRNNQFVASGVYFYHVEGPDGQTKVGRFTVVNYAQ